MRTLDLATPPRERVPVPTLNDIAPRPQNDVAPARILAVPECEQVLNGAADELPSARETQPFLANSNQPTLPKSEILEPSF